MHMRRNTLMIVSATLLVACGNETDDNARVVGQLASDRIELTAEIAEPITEIPVAEGARVTAGTVLLRQDRSRAEARLAEAVAGVAEAQARLDELTRGPRSERIVAARANLDGAERDLEFRRAEYRRIQEVHALKLASPEQLDQAKAALDAARASLDRRNAELEELLAGTTVEELAQAEQALRQAEARRDQVAVDVARHEIKAPVDGIVDTRVLEIGERPAIGQAMIIFLDGAQPHARVYVPEALRVRISPGTQARVFVDGLDGSIAGTVRWVASEAAFTPYFALTERDRGRLSFAAKIDLDAGQDRLPDGVPVEVEFDLP